MFNFALPYKQDNNVKITVRVKGIVPSTCGLLCSFLLIRLNIKKTLGAFLYPLKPQKEYILLSASFLQFIYHIPHDYQYHNYDREYGISAYVQPELLPTCQLLFYGIRNTKGVYT